MVEKKGPRPKLLPIDALIESIDDCVAQFVMIKPENTLAQHIVSGSIVSLCHVLRRSKLTPVEQIRVASQLGAIRQREVANGLWKLYEKRGKDPIMDIVELCGQAAELPQPA